MTDPTSLHTAGGSRLDPGGRNPQRFLGVQSSVSAGAGKCGVVLEGQVDSNISEALGDVAWRRQIRLLVVVRAIEQIIRADD